MMSAAPSADLQGEAPVTAASSGNGKGKAVMATAPVTPADDKIREGKRMLLKNQIDDASICFEQALEMVVTEYGDLADECADAYRFYGTSLLQIAKRESSLLGTDASKGSAAPAAPNDDTASASASASASSGPAEEEEEEEQDDDEPSTEQLAWETLECARIILKRQKTSGAALRLAMVHYDLGEYLLETAEFANAVQEFDECLALRKAHLATDDRLLAETYYTLALANDHAKNFEAAISAYTHAISIMQTSIGQCSDAEAAGLKGVVVELESKIVEAREELAKKPAAAGPSAAAKPDPFAAAAAGKNKRMMGDDSQGTTIGFGAPSSGATTIGFGAASASDPVESSGFAKPTGNYTQAAPTDLTARVKKRAKLEPVSS